MNKNNTQKRAPKKNNKNVRKQNVKRQQAPVASGVVTMVGRPKFVNRGQDVTVSHREYVTDVFGSTSTFSQELTLQLNPGNPSTFPWLSAIARRFESYRFKRLVFCYETETSTGTSGFVLLTIDYDPSDPAPTSKIVAFNYQGAIKGAPWQSFKHNSTVQNLSKRKTYFVSETVQNDRDLYDTGNLYVCVGGQASTAKLGELWVEYEVNLLTPQLENNSVLQVNSQRYVGTSSLAPAKPFGTAPTDSITGARLVSYDGSTGIFTNACTFQIQFLVCVRYTGTGITNTSCATTGTAGSALNMVILASGLEAEECYYVELDLDQTFTPSASATTITASEILIVPFGLFE